MADGSVSPEVVRDDGAEAQHPHPVSQVRVVPGMAELSKHNIKSQKEISADFLFPNARYFCLTIHLNEKLILVS